MESCTGALILATTSPFRRHWWLNFRLSEKVQVSEVDMMILGFDSENWTENIIEIFPQFCILKKSLSLYNGKSSLQIGLIAHSSMFLWHLQEISQAITVWCRNCKKISDSYISTKHKRYITKSLFSVITVNGRKA